MTLYYAKDKERGITVNIAGKPLLVSSEIVLEGIIGRAKEIVPSLDIEDYDICSIEVGVVHEPILRFEEELLALVAEVEAYEKEHYPTEEKR